MAEIIGLLEGVPGGWLFAILLLLVFGPLAVLSKSAAEKFGLFGVIARWWRNRPLQRIEQDEKQVAAEVAVLERRVDTLEDHIRTITAEQRRERQEYLAAAAEDRKQWRAALDDAEKEIDSIRHSLRARDKSILSLYDWTIRARVEALTNGVILSPVPDLPVLSVPGGIDTGPSPPSPPAGID